MRRARVFVCLAGLALGAGCQGNRAERVAASYSSVTKPSLAQALPPKAQTILIGTDAIPVEEDYEERAASTITDANLKAQLAEIEAEIE